MKNIERLEVQGVILSIMLGKLTTYNGIKGLIKLGFHTEIVMEGDFYSYLFSDLKKWFNSEYVEPHH